MLWWWPPRDSGLDVGVIGGKRRARYWKAGCSWHLNPQDAGSVWKCRVCRACVFVNMSRASRVRDRCRLDISSGAATLCTSRRRRSAILPRACRSTRSRGTRAACPRARSSPRVDFCSESGMRKCSGISNDSNHLLQRCHGGVYS